MEANNLPEIGLLGAVIAILLCLTMSGCALRVSVTPIQAEEFKQQTMTNQLFDWLFKGSSKEAK